MASQIAHIVYAKKYFDRLDSEGLNDLEDEKTLLVPTSKISRDEFILGCVFPDIRRIDKSIKRKDTHLYFPVLNLNFSGLTSFEAGWKFHLYCDMKREEILNKYNFYSFKNDTKFYIQAAKFLEEELIYDEYNNWEKIVNYFNNPPYIKNNLNISPETFGLWYAILAKYVERKPENKTIRIFAVKTLEDPENTESIMKSVDELQKNDKVVEILKKIKDQIV
ncbi:MAG: hypothetical protein COX29_04145 [Candidatus Moranbacteria bacterium CG23_combo_of_CG06-09_8_20_14_all_35_22]|nr:MAG: hypothetical protein COX29_04145 [Candidatus Moranbacteria bacterium CG23_combo_of_CG06-09_8_20_14_all_35_22]